MRARVGNWSREDLVSYLRSGHNRITAATGPMGEVVTLSTAPMTDPDLNAIATYLKSSPGKSGNASPLPPDHLAMVGGAAIYRSNARPAMVWTAKASVNSFLPSLILRWSDRRMPRRRSGSFCEVPEASGRAPRPRHPGCPPMVGNSTTTRSRPFSPRCEIVGAEQPSQSRPNKSRKCGAIPRFDRTSRVGRRSVHLVALQQNGKIWIT